MLTAIAALAALASFFTTFAASAETPISVASYTYDNAAQLTNAAGEDTNYVSGTANLNPSFHSLTNGLGRAGEYVPTAHFWENATQEGTIYENEDSDISSNQPSPGITFDFGGVKAFSSVRVHYGVEVNNAVYAPNAVEILVDNVSIGTFGGFDASNNINNFGDIRLNTIVVGAQAGQLVTLKFRGGISFVGATWHGLTEVEFLPPAPIPVASYTYDNAAQLTNAFGEDTNYVSGTANLDPSFDSLTNGLGRAGEYVPTAHFWENATQEGTIYENENSDILSNQPSPGITFDFGIVWPFNTVRVHYGVEVTNAVEAPEAVEILVDNVSIGTFGGFDTSNNVNNFGDIRLDTIHVGAQAGQFVTLKFRGGISGAFATWHGLTEVEFLPEPSFVVMLSLGSGVLAILRRRRM